MKKVVFLTFLAVLFFAVAIQPAYAKELKIIFTGQTYSMIYPCACPVSREGGVARRATVIKQLRSKYKDIILVEAGNSFASGPEDQYSQNSDMDLRRTEVYLDAINTMKYDALLVSSQEYAFGTDFIAKNKNLPFITSNMEGFSRGYLIKDMGWIKVGILGITSNRVNDKAVSGWAVPSVILPSKIAELKSKGARLIILLSSQTLEEDKALLAKLKGISVVINGSKSYSTVLWNDISGAICVTTWWQSRQVGILTLEVSGRKVEKKNLESFILGSDVADDEAIKELLPECFQAFDCKRTPGLVVKCENASEKQARCVYTTPKKVALTVVSPRKCGTCKTKEVLNNLSSVFGEMTVKFLYEDEPKTAALIKKLDLTMLPAYIFDGSIEKSEYFDKINPNLIYSNGSYLLKPEYAGVSYILNRKRIPGRIDVFFGFDEMSTTKFFDLLKTFQSKHRNIDIRFHLLAVPDKKIKGKFLTRYGNLYELEELERIACIDTLYPAETLDYLICRSKNRSSTWWDACLVSGLMDVSKVKACATSKQAEEAMTKHTALTEELKIAGGPTFIIDNKEILGMINVPSLEDFEKAVFSNQNKDQERSA